MIKDAIDRIVALAAANTKPNLVQQTEDKNIYALPSANGESKLVEIDRPRNAHHITLGDIKSFVRYATNNAKAESYVMVQEASVWWEQNFQQLARHTAAMNFVATDAFAALSVLDGNWRTQKEMWLDLQSIQSPDAMNLALRIGSIRASKNQMSGAQINNLGVTTGKTSERKISIHYIDDAGVPQDLAIQQEYVFNMRPYTCSDVVCPFKMRLLASFRDELRFQLVSVDKQDTLNTFLAELADTLTKEFPSTPVYVA